MKRFISFCILAAVTLLLASCNSNKQTDDIELKRATLKVEGTQLMNELGDTVQLKGVSLGWHIFWPRFYNKNTINTLVDDWNCTLIRAAMAVEPEGSYIDDSIWAKKCLYEVVDACIEKKTHVIIDWHSHGYREKEAKEFFAQMAQKYGDSPYVIYEIFNEPEETSWDSVKSYCKNVIDTIRMYDKDNIILVASPHWDQDVDVAADSPLEGYSNIMYSLHFYAGFHQKWHRGRADYALKKGLPIFVSECASMTPFGTGDINYVEYQKWMDWINENKLSWIAWSVAPKNETCSMIQPWGSTEGPWKEDELKEWGIMTRELLRGEYVYRDSVVKDSIVIEPQK